MIMMSTSGADMFASANLPYQARLCCNLVPADVAAIACAFRAIDRLAIKLRQQDVRDRLQHRIRSAFEQVRDTHVQLSIAQPDGVIDRNKGIETNMHRRSRRARTQFAVGCVKNLGELRRHLEGRLARGSSQQSGEKLEGVPSV